MRIDEINERLAAIEGELETAEGDNLTELENEVNELTEERNVILAEAETREQLRHSIAAGKKGTPMPKMNPKPEVNEEERSAKEFLQKKELTFSAEETRSAILTSGNLATPTEVKGINDIAGAKVSSIIDLCRVENCEGMSTDRVAYVATDNSAAAGQTEGSAATEGEPVFNYVDITPTDVAIYSQISKQAKKRTPLNYKAKVTEQALLALRKKAAALATTALTGSTLNLVAEAETKTVSTDVFGTVTEKTLRKLVLNHGGDEGINGGVLFLNKTDLLAFGDVRGTNEKKAVYEITPDTDNPNTGTIRDGGLSVRYCLNSNLTACNGTEQGAADIVTMVYGDPMALQLDLFSPYEIKVSEDFAFTSLMDTILGDVELGAAVVVKHGFTAWTIKKASA